LLERQTGVPEVLRLYDPARQPPNWIDIVRPTQYVVFSSDVVTGGTMDADGRPFASATSATCLVFDSLAEARQFCEARVLDVPSVRFEVFDARGRVESPLLVVVSPAHAATLEGSARAIRLRKWMALAMLAAAPPLMWYDFAVSRGSMVLPSFVAVSMVVIALRLLFMNMAVREADRNRRARLDRHE
jgi:hypothetical protein